MDDSKTPIDALLQRGAQRLTGHQRRLFLAEVTVELCGGNARQAERRSGGAARPSTRDCTNYVKAFAVWRTSRLAAGSPLGRRAPATGGDIRELVEPHTQADPELKVVPALHQRVGGGSA